MRLLSAELEGFRNFERAELHPSPFVTGLVGENGQGKTNALEAIYLISALRPLRSVPRKALIKEGFREAKISVRVSHANTGLEHELELRLDGSSRTLLKDGKKVSASELLGGLVAVAFTPDDLQLPKGSPDGRRRFLDRALLNSRPSYLGHALRYARAMKDRNRLLARDASDAELDVFDEMLAKEGAAISVARRSYVSRIAPRVSERFDAIASPAPKLVAKYSSALREGTEEEVREEMLRTLAVKRGKDRVRNTTSVGPHLDDLVLTLDGSSVKERASQGQHRALVLALKLIEIEELAADLGEPPLLLLDDMSSELDEGRTLKLFTSVRALDGQVILTATADPHPLVRLLGSERPLIVQRVHQGSLSAPEELRGASEVEARSSDSP